jgi:DNA-binding protein H-NS
MARKSLRPYLNQIRTWTRQGRTDAWVAHQLEVTVQQIASFKRESGLLDEEPGAAGVSPVDLDEEIDLRAEDDALIAAELEAAEQARREEEEAAAAEAERLAAQDALRGGEDEDGAPKRRARRGGRIRRGAKTASGPLEGTFDHGEEGYGLWLDPAVADDPIYAEHWAGHRPVAVTIEEDQIVIRRSE